MIPRVPLKMCEWNRVLKKLTLASEFCGMPSELIVDSPSGASIKFRPIGEDHPQFDQDQWDGEQMIYEPAVPIPNVEVLVIYNQY
jgi:hypothetical protein